YSYSFKHENSNARRLRNGIQELVKKTGLDTLMVNIPDRDLGYTGIEFNVNFSEENTSRLMTAARSMSQRRFVALATKRVDEYFRTMNDPYNYCQHHNSEDNFTCAAFVRGKTAKAAVKM